MENNKFISTDIVSTFRLPRYSEIPDVGLYLEQTTKYINSLISPIGFEITGSMIRNYVKMGLVNNTVHKLYYRDQIAHLIAVAILKNVVSLENIAFLFKRQPLPQFRTILLNQNSQGSDLTVVCTNGLAGSHITAIQLMKGVFHAFLTPRCNNSPF